MLLTKKTVMEMPHFLHIQTPPLFAHLSPLRKPLCAQKGQAVLQFPRVAA